VREPLYFPLFCCCFDFCARVNCARGTRFIQIYQDVETNWNDFCLKGVFVLFLYLDWPLAIVGKSRYIQFVIEQKLLICFCGNNNRWVKADMCDNDFVIVHGPDLSSLRKPQM
jgi:hypothetical protein